MMLMYLLGLGVGVYLALTLLPELRNAFESYIADLVARNYARLRTS